MHNGSFSPYPTWKGINLIRKDHISPEEPEASGASIRSPLLAKLPSILLHIFIAVVVIAIVVPLNPRMPSKGLDASWEFAMNEAVARHLTFGKQIMFTYGPYAAIGTRTYSPATDRRMMWGSFSVAVSYLAGLLFLARGKRRYLMLFLLLFLATFGNPELLLLSYSFLLAACAVKYMNPVGGGEPAELNWRQILAAVLMWSTLGLLPLVKGSLLLPFAAAVVIPSALFLCKRRYSQGVVLLLLPIASAAGLWIFSGQSLGNLPAFLRGTFLLTSGYTEAMSSSWLILPTIIGDGLVITFLAILALMCWSICRTNELRLISKSMLATIFVLFLLVIFKHGFVKAGGVSSAFCSLAVLIMIVGLLQMDGCLIWSLTVATILTAGTSVMQDAMLFKEVHEKFGPGVTWSGERRADIFAFCMERAIEAYSRTTYQSAWRTFADSWEGLRLRAGQRNDLDVRYARAIDDIRSGDPLPPLMGSADVYESEQSILLASNNEWNPRPVFQSYSAYTPSLARLNEQHLRGQDAPDWVLFDLQSIGGRFPALDDGVSWPALLDNYTFVSYDGQFVLLRRMPVVHASSDYRSVLSQTCKTGSTIVLPATDGLLFAEIDLKPTLAGQVLVALFNPPELRITIGLRNGKTIRYRTVSNMMGTGFLVSPFVGDTKDFAALMAGKRDIGVENEVKTISIAPTYGGPIFWSATYEMTLKKYGPE
jgi:hypothetical protein